MIKDRISSLRSIMSEERIDMYIIPTSDFHNSEYVGEYFTARAYMSGFTGSAGTLVVTADFAGLWTDGRYFLQAADQLKGTGIELMKMGCEGVPTIAQYISANIKGGILGFDGRVLSLSEGKSYAEAAEEGGGQVRPDIDLVDRIWTDRPGLSANPIFTLDEAYAGESAASKLAKLRTVMKEKGCSYHVLTSLDDIAWLLNLRGSDVACNPVFLSYLIVGETDAVLFANEEVMKSNADYLKELNIAVEPYASVYEYVRHFERGCGVLVDGTKLNYMLYNILSDLYDVQDEINPSTLLKACKNPVEIDNLRQCNITDGVAMVRFLYWLDRTIGHETITEMSAAAQLESFRSLGDGYQGISFDTISGYGPHGAIIHYEPTAETDVEIRPEGLLLVDSGAQYLSGTTDITRTIAVGPLNDEMRHHYTMVLRANLNLASARFVEGTSGANLDILARAPFWDEGLDYNHGTGHGVGFFLNVHEGPQSFHWNTKRKSSLTALKEGMVITDEPGIYIEGQYGIRIENDLLCLKDYKNEYAQFMCFEPLTLCPIDLRPVNFDEMNAKEIRALAKYHEMVCEQLLPYLNPDEAMWLKDATRIPSAYAQAACI